MIALLHLISYFAGLFAIGYFGAEVRMPIAITALMGGGYGFVISQSYVHFAGLAG